MTDKRLSDFTDEELTAEMMERDFYVYDVNMENQECEECENRDFHESELEKERDCMFEAIHYLLASGKNEQAIEKMRELISTQTGHVS